MPQFDYEGQITVSPSINPSIPSTTVGTLVTGTATTNGTSVSMDGCLGAVVVFSYGDASGTGAVTPVIEESSTAPGTASFTAVAAADLSGATLTQVGTATDSVTQQYGYIGSGRWLRASANVHGTPVMCVSAQIVKFISVKD